MRNRGFIVLELDIRFGCDLLQTRVLQKIRGALAGGVIDIIHFGTPCTSFSRARCSDGLGPGPLRSGSFPSGLPNLTDTDQDKVRIGNLCARATISLASCALRHGVAGSIENPCTSFIWSTEVFANFLRRRPVRTLNLDFCRFGCPWRKRTKIAFWMADLESLRLTCSSKGGYCDVTGRKHIVLSGKCPETKQFRTKIAEPYPTELTKRWAQCFKNAVTARTIATLLRACG